MFLPNIDSVLLSICLVLFLNVHFALFAKWPNPIKCNYFLYKNFAPLRREFILYCDLQTIQITKK